MTLFPEKSSKYIGTVILSAMLSLNSAFAERRIVSLGTFFNRERWKINKEEAKKKYGNEWKEKYFKDPKAVYQANLKDFYREKLSNTHLYILISSYRQASLFGKEIVKSLEANAQHLTELGVTPHIIVRCDGETKNGKSVVSSDLRVYAERLNQEKIAFKIHESERVKPSDFYHEYHNPEAIHWELVANETNLGCSGTRHAGIDAIEEEVEELQNQGKCVYIGIFDGDDWVHEDYFPVLVLNALYSRATVSNYNGRLGAHGLEGVELRKKRMLGEYTWTLYTDMKHDAVEETLSETYKAIFPGANCSCCTTKIFEAGYFYRKLESLCKEKFKHDSNAKRDWIDLTELSCLNGFGEGACTCTTPIGGGSLFHYTKHN